MSARNQCRSKGAVCQSDAVRQAESPGVLAPLLCGLKPDLCHARERVGSPVLSKDQGPGTAAGRGSWYPAQGRGSIPLGFRQLHPSRPPGEVTSCSVAGGGGPAEEQSRGRLLGGCRS